MASGNDPDELSEEDQAALSDYENSEEGKAAGTPAPETLAEWLTKLFSKTPEMVEYRQAVDSINVSLDRDDVAHVHIDVPRGFIQMTEFLEQKRALAAGVDPLPAQKVLGQILLNELHDQLHGLITGPARFGYYRDLWNRFCDQHNAADLKLGEQQPQPPAEEF